MPCISICRRISPAFDLPCVVGPHAALARLSLPFAQGQFPSVLFKVLCRRSDIKSVRRTNVAAAVAHSCRSVPNSFSFDFKPPRYTAVCRQGIYKRKFTAFIIYILKNGSNYRFVKPKLKLHYIFCKHPLVPWPSKMFH